MDVIQHWGYSPSSFKFIPISDGLINDSWKLEPSSGLDIEEPLFLQKINTEVFKKPESVQDNHAVLYGHLSSTDYPFLKPIWSLGENGKTWFFYQGEYWRLGAFFENTQTYHQVESADMAWKVGQAFGIYDHRISNLSTGSIQDTIPQFHHLQRYLEILADVVTKAETERLANSKKLLDQIEQYIYLTQVPFPKNRIIHNDAKISNILFQEDVVRAIIDWDTTMAGHIGWEFGDLVRTSTISVAEDHPEVDAIHIIMDYLEGLTAGFKAEINDLLTSAEKEVLFEGMLYLIFEQAVRFLADYLAGDLYYKCDYDSHNYIRARNQFYVLEILMKDQYEIKKCLLRS